MRRTDSSAPATDKSTPLCVSPLPLSQRPRRFSDTLTLGNWCVCAFFFLPHLSLAVDTWCCRPSPAPSSSGIDFVWVWCVPASHIARNPPAVSFTKQVSAGLFCFSLVEIRFLPTRRFFRAQEGSHAIPRVKKEIKWEDELPSSNSCTPGYADERNTYVPSSEIRKCVPKSKGDTLWHTFQFVWLLKWAGGVIQKRWDRKTFSTFGSTQKIFEPILSEWAFRTEFPDETHWDKGGKSVVTGPQIADHPTHPGGMRQWKTRFDSKSLHASVLPRVCLGV